MLSPLPFGNYPKVMSQVEICLVTHINKLRHTGNGESTRKSVCVAMSVKTAHTQERARVMAKAMSVKRERERESVCVCVC